jgi:hypothetical protein
MEHAESGELSRNSWHMSPIAYHKSFLREEKAGVAISLENSPNPNLILVRLRANATCFEGTARPLRASEESDPLCIGR